MKINSTKKFKEEFRDNVMLKIIGKKPEICTKVVEDYCSSHIDTIKSFYSNFDKTTNTFTVSVTPRNMNDVTFTFTMTPTD